MKISEAWLREWVNPLLTTKNLAHQLTMAGLEVDAIYPVAGNFTQVVVAKVLHTSAHPEADKLTLCEVEHQCGQVSRIVCGARNVRAGLMVALALPGATLPGDMVIKISQLRGQISEGMLCSSSELGLEERSEGILELPNDAPIGMDLREYLVLNDQVLDLDLTPNRADCFSILGVAREVAALNNLPFSRPAESLLVSTIDDSMAVNISDASACPVYCTRLLQGINSQAMTPIWIKERLRRGGIRAIHPVVDVLNYVMLETGQPLHAFDADVLQGELHIRYSDSNEKLTLLDEKVVTLHERTLLIADKEKPLAIAGVIGALQGSVQENTVNIRLEAAFFEPLVISGVARRFGLCTDASQRFERGVDPTLAEYAINRATELLLTIVGGAVGPIKTFKDISRLAPPVQIIFNPQKVQHITGLIIPEEEMKAMLQRLGMFVTTSSLAWCVEVPAHRFDLSLDVDLIEEIVRLYGYENIQALPTKALLKVGSHNNTEALAHKMATFLSNLGYQETVNYAFVDPALQEVMYPKAHSIVLKNPLSPELSHMRVGLWPGLLAAMIHNLHRQQTALQLFERGVVFERLNGEIQEQLCVAGLITGESGTFQWNAANHKFDFYDLKGDLEALFAHLSLSSCTFIEDAHAALHPGKTARIVTSAGEPVGFIGALHPRIQDALDLTQEILVFELKLSDSLIKKPMRYAPISKYPQTRRDLSLLVPVLVSAADIEEVIREVVADGCLKYLHIFDVYRGDPIPLDKKSIAIAIILQRLDRTLVELEITSMIDAILDALDTRLSVQLRME